MASPRYGTDALHALATSLITQAGAPTDTALLVSDSLLAADRAGIYSHGLLRLPLYLEVVAAGGIDPTSMPRILRQFGGVTVLDGGCAFGQVVMQRAVDIALESARTHGIATVAVQGSSHYGAGQYWTGQLAEHGIAAILSSTTGPVATPFGGSRSVLGTNPLTIALPSAGPHPLVTDLATTAGAYGKIVAARNEGTDIPSDWGVDAAAQPSTDPAAVLEGGALLPFGGHKGSGISVLLEGLSAALTSASFAFQTVDIWQDHSSRMNTGHLLIALDLAAFGDVEEIRARVAELQDEVRSSHPGSPVLAPGDLEHARLVENADAVEVAPSTLEQLRHLADQHDLPFPTPLAEKSPR